MAPSKSQQRRGNNEGQQRLSEGKQCGNIPNHHRSTADLDLGR